MKVLNAEQIRSWDQYTITNEPVSSLDLMERAANACLKWFDLNNYTPGEFIIVCGKGNNGGDGLALARLLTESGSKVSIQILEFGNRGTDDFQANLERLHRYPGVPIHFIQSEDHIHEFPKGAIVIDALFGSGLTRPLEHLSSRIAEHINNSGCLVVSIDIPSGLSADHSSKGNTAVNAHHTLSFQCYKPALLMAENAGHVGEVHILDIGLDPRYEKNLSDFNEVIDKELIKGIYRPRNRFAHKGNFGHALMLAGSYGKMGAAILCARSCLRGGAGLLTVHVPSAGYEIMQTGVPEAMIITDYNSSFITTADFTTPGYSVIGCGPGMGTASETRNIFRELFSAYHKPVVLDADALNCISQEKILLNSIPANSILTPHPKEFERLFGHTENDFTRIQLALERARTLNVLIVLKGHHSFIATPGGKGYFNNTGNAGMATAGSGDVLTGILTSLLSQGYDPINAAILGVYLHGLAGDIAAAEKSIEGLIASDIIENIGAAYLQISRF